MCTMKTITSFTTATPDVTSKQNSTAKVSEVPACSKKETLEKFPSIGFYLRKDNVSKSEIG